jgi:hypothetical protein
MIHGFLDDYAFLAKAFFDPLSSFTGIENICVLLKNY